MNILYASSEARPYVASGGLADVAFALPCALNNSIIVWNKSQAEAIKK